MLPEVSRCSCLIADFRSSGVSSPSNRRFASLKEVSPCILSEHPSKPSEAATCAKAARVGMRGGSITPSSHIKSVPGVSPGMAIFRRDRLYMRGVRDLDERHARPSTTWNPDQSHHQGLKHERQLSRRREGCLHRRLGRRRHRGDRRGKTYTVLRTYVLPSGPGINLEEIDAPYSYEGFRAERFRRARDHREDVSVFRVALKAPSKFLQTA